MASKFNQNSVNIQSRFNHIHSFSIKFNPISINNQSKSITHESIKINQKNDTLYSKVNKKSIKNPSKSIKRSHNQTVCDIISTDCKQEAMPLCIYVSLLVLALVVVSDLGWVVGLLWIGLDLYCTCALSSALFFTRLVSTKPIYVSSDRETERQRGREADRKRDRETKKQGSCCATALVLLLVLLALATRAADGSCCWLLLLAPAAGSCCWLLLLALAVGTCCCSPSAVLLLLLVLLALAAPAAAGSRCWLLLLAPADGSCCWLLLIVLLVIAAPAAACSCVAAV